MSILLVLQDPFGNYLFQKIAEKVDENGRTELINKVGMGFHSPPVEHASELTHFARNTVSAFASDALAQLPGFGLATFVVVMASSRPTSGGR